MDDNRFDFYANAVNVVMGLYDLILSFSTQSFVGMQEGKPVIESGSTCNVRMSPQHAKSLAAILVSNVKEYETKFNVVLPITEDLQKKWEEFIK